MLGSVRLEISPVRWDTDRGDDEPAEPAASLFLRGEEQAAAGESLPGRTRISGSPNLETRIFGCERTRARSSSTETASVKNKNYSQ